MEFHIKPFDELTPRELYAILRERIDIFVVEQNCVYRECDDKDPKAWHLWLEECGRPVASLRVLPPAPPYDTPRIGRVVVAATHRRQGLATRLLRHAIEYIESEFGHTPIRLASQCYAQKVYEGVGFRACGEPFLEDGILHVEMTRTPA